MKKAKEYDHMIWDFNGTLLDDVWHGITAVNKLLRRKGLPQITDLEAYYDVFCFPIKAYYEKLGLLDGEPFEDLAHEWVAAYRENEANIPMRPGAERLLRAVRELGISQSVLSATEAEMLALQLSYLGLEDFFDCVLGRTDIYATDKTDIAVAFRCDHPSERVLMIGDTDHDLLTARAAGFDCVLVHGGHQSAAYLDSLGCDTVPDLEALRKELGL